MTIPRTLVNGWFDPFQLWERHMVLALVDQEAFDFIVCGLDQCYVGNKYRDIWALESKMVAPVWAPASILRAVESAVWGSMTIWEIDRSLEHYSVKLWGGK